MPDIRLVRRRGNWVWPAVGSLSLLCLLVWASATFFLGDATMANRRKGGAMAGFGRDRAPVMPLQKESFAEVKPLEDRELGRLLHISGYAESGVVHDAVWVHSHDGRRILVRFEPSPGPGALRGVHSGAGVSLDGYLQRLARADFNAWMDSLGISIPRPEPGVKFGDLPDPNFARVDSLFIKTYYLSVRPEGINARPPAGTAPVPAAPAPGMADSAEAAATGSGEAP